jgi:N-acetylmuramoyl-L-alanine amidase
MRLLPRKVTAAKAFARAERLCLLATLLLGLNASSAAATRAAPATPYNRAEQSLQSLESRPEDQRGKRDYERTLDLFRAVYHDDPASPKADASIFAVANLLAEQGRLFHDDKSLRDAVGQYEFLRREYPGSRYRANALMAEANIQLHDLNDRAAAKAAYQACLKEYPGSPLATEARTRLKEIRAEDTAAKHATPAPVPATAVPSATTAHATASLPQASRHSSTVLTAAVQSQSDEAAPAQTPQTTRSQPKPATLPTPAPPAQTKPIPEVQAAALTPPSMPDSPRRKGRLVSVTGVRHWSTPIYTRVAIDLGDEVQYEAARVPDPDRIFFDLHGAKLSPELVGKSVTVTDDGFLKRIRIAQFSNDVTRIVLDVSDVSDYSAFLLPNPYRLIIDIHGRKPGAANAQLAAQATPPGPAPQRAVTTATPPAAAARPSPRPAVSTASDASLNAAASAPNRRQAAPAQAPRQSATATVTNPAAPVNDPAATQEIASLSHQPDRVKATTRPTTAPIAASVAGTTPAAQPDLSRTAPTPTRNSRHAKSQADADPSTATASIHEADPTAEGGRSMVRALGLKIGRIVVDAGHGGHDSGTLGPDGIEEKDVVLDVSLRLGKLLKQRLGADVIFTRSDDTFIPLETRTAIANKAQADLFVSVHANSSPDASARGVETYYLNFTSSPESLELAARENAVSQQSIHQLSDLVKKIALHDKIDESREFASDVEKYLYEGLDQGNPGLKDRGVKQAPFVVLIGANMPSILAEISFLTNPDDARQLRDPNYRQRIAESLYRGVARYVSGLSGVRLAENTGHPAGD